MRKILCIDGGGIRGLIPAMVLAEIEKRTGRRIAEFFDLIAGTSTGGVMACIIADGGFNIKDMIGLYENEGPRIFKKTFAHSLKSSFGFFGPKYPADGLRDVLEEYLGTSSLSHCVPDILIPAYDIENRRPVLFKSQKAKVDHTRDFTLADVACAAASAPTYFPPAQIFSIYQTLKLSLIDGGVYANNPTMCAIVEAQKLWPGEELLVISLGTGELTRKISYGSAKNWGLAGWAQPILNVVFDGMSDVVSYQAQKVLGKNYYRLQCTLDIALDDMDDASEQNLKDLKLQAKNLIWANSTILDVICKELI